MHVYHILDKRHRDRHHELDLKTQPTKTPRGAAGSRDWEVMTKHSLLVPTTQECNVITYQFLKLKNRNVWLTRQNKLIICISFFNVKSSVTINQPRICNHGFSFSFWILMGLLKDIYIYIYGGPLAKFGHQAMCGRRLNSATGRLDIADCSWM